MYTVCTVGTVCTLWTVYTVCTVYSMHSTGPLTNQSVYSFLFKGETTKRPHCGWNNKGNKNCNDFMRNRTRDLSVSSAVLEPSAPPRAAWCNWTPRNSRGYLCLVKLCNYKCLNTGLLHSSAVFIHTYVIIAMYCACRRWTIATFCSTNWFCDLHR